jgi:hypothetical protein
VLESVEGRKPFTGKIDKASNSFSFRAAEAPAPVHVLSAVLIDSRSAATPSFLNELVCSGGARNSERVALSARETVLTVFLDFARI